MSFFFDLIFLNCKTNLMLHHPEQKFAFQVQNSKARGMKTGKHTTKTFILQTRRSNNEKPHQSRSRRFPATFCNFIVKCPPRKKIIEMHFLWSVHPFVSDHRLVQSCFSMSVHPEQLVPFTTLAQRCVYSQVLWCDLHSLTWQCKIKY